MVFDKLSCGICVVGAAYRPLTNSHREATNVMRSSFPCATERLRVGKGRADLHFLGGGHYSARRLCRAGWEWTGAQSRPLGDPVRATGLLPSCCVTLGDFSPVSRSVSCRGGKQRCPTPNTQGGGWSSGMSVSLGFESDPSLLPWPSSSTPLNSVSLSVN